MTAFTDSYSQADKAARAAILAVSGRGSYPTLFGGTRRRRSRLDTIRLSPPFPLAGSLR